MHLQYNITLIKISEIERSPEKSEQHLTKFCKRLSPSLKLIEIALNSAKNGAQVLTLHENLRIMCG